MKGIISTAALALAAFVFGCGSSVPQTRVASAENAVRSARASGADSVPEASRQLRMAEQELAQAKKLNADKDHDEAEAMFSRAEADAALATSLAKESKTKAKIGSGPEGSMPMLPDQQQQQRQQQPMQQPGR